MEINFSTRELDKFFSVGIILMYQVEELLLLKHFLEQEPLELLVISFSFIDQLQFMSHHQHGETIMLSLQKLDSRLEHIDISTRKLKDLISMVWLKIFKTPPQDQLFYYTHALTTQPVLIQLLINGKRFTKLWKPAIFMFSSILLIKVLFQET